MTQDSYLFVLETNRFMSVAKKRSENVQRQFPWARFITASVIVKDGKIIAQAVNQNVHFSFCPRRVFDSASGEDYELCPRHCHPDNHSEARALKEAGKHAKGADLYMYGHWWCCKPCWDAMIQAGINNVFLVENAKERFYYDPGERKTESPKSLFYHSVGPFNDEFAAFLEKVNILRNKSRQEKSDFILTYLSSNSYAVGKKVIVFNSSRDFISQLSQALEEKMLLTSDCALLYTLINEGSVSGSF